MNFKKGKKTMTSKSSTTKNEKKEKPEKMAIKSTKVATKTDDDSATAKMSSSFTKRAVSHMIDESWEKLENDCISLDELNALLKAFEFFPKINTSKEKEIIRAKILELQSDAKLAAEAEERSEQFTQQKLEEDAANQPNSSDFSEAEEGPEED